MGIYLILVAGTSALVLTGLVLLVKSRGVPYQQVKREFAVNPDMSDVSFQGLLENLYVQQQERAELGISLLVLGSVFLTLLLSNSQGVVDFINGVL